MSNVDLKNIIFIIITFIIKMGEVLILNLRQQLADSFRNPFMKKVNEVRGLSIYKARVNNMLIAAQPHYIVAIVPRDNYPIFQKRQLSDLKWISFQTRQIPKNEKDDDIDSIPCCEMPSQSTKEILLNDAIVKIAQTEEKVEYISKTLPCSIVIIPQGQNKTAKFQENTNFYKALMYFNTVVSIT
jgi:hypothetical protein